VSHQFSGFICDPLNIKDNAPHIGVCTGTTLNVVVFDTSGVPDTTIKAGDLVTNGSTTVSGVIDEQVKYDTTSDNGLDTDRMTIEACVDASSHVTCVPAP